MKKKRVFVFSRRKKKTGVIPEKTGESVVGYTTMDACICCGRYMAEGTGMVCPECLGY